MTKGELGSASASASARTWTSGWRRTSGALALALAICLGVYLLLETVRPDSGLVSFSFLVISPAAICAFTSYIADPWGERRRATYLWIPVWILVAVAVISFVALREGVICILLLAPLWLISGIAGSALTYSVRHRLKRGRTYCAALLVAPLVAMQIEPLVTLPDAQFLVSRTIVVHASPEKIWPLLRGIPDVLPSEGKWNVTQDVIGVPRPLGARLIGNGIGADRYARWAHGLRFREQITDWSQDRRIGWRFIFERGHGWEYTDRHLVPDSPYFRIEEGGYSLQPINSTHTRLTLRTQYWIQTPLNFYCAWWGELFLGDLSDNLLTLVKNRAEHARLDRDSKPF